MGSFAADDSGSRRVGFDRAGRAAEHVFLRNEPDLVALVFERIRQGDRDLERGSGFFESGSFGKAEFFLGDKTTVPSV